MTKQRKIRMPRNKADFMLNIYHAFLAGCNYGYGVEHTKSVREQEELGALAYIGEISNSELQERLEILLEDSLND